MIYYKSRKNSIIAGWSSLVARRAHNPEVVGSNPAPATKKLLLNDGHRYDAIKDNIFLYGEVAQLARAFGSYPECQEFKSLLRYHFFIK